MGRREHRAALTPHTARDVRQGGRCGGSPPAQGRAGTARPSNGSCQWSVARNCGGGDRGSDARLAGDAHARSHGQRWRWQHAGIAHAWWHFLAVADTRAASAPTRCCRRGVRGALRGESPRTRKGRNGPTVQNAAASCQWPGTAGAGYGSGSARGNGICDSVWTAPARRRLAGGAPGGF